MIHRFATIISSWCCKTLMNTEEEQIVIQYGTEVFLDGIIKVIILFIIGFLMGFPIEFMMVLFFFCSLRYWAGGHHCKTSARCLWAMILLCIVSVYGANVFKKVEVMYLFIAMIVALILLMIFAPGQTILNPITDEKVIRKKKWGAIIWASLECIFIILVIDMRWKWTFFCPIFIEAISIIPYWENKKRKGEKI